MSRALTAAEAMATRPEPAPRLAAEFDQAIEKIMTGAGTGAHQASDGSAEPDPHRMPAPVAREPEPVVATLAVETPLYEKWTPAEPVAAAEPPAAFRGRLENLHQTLIGLARDLYDGELNVYRVRPILESQGDVWGPAALVSRKLNYVLRRSPAFEPVGQKGRWLLTLEQPEAAPVEAVP